jgi:thiol-disulfide isomerase/thioredoxin
MLPKENDVGGNFAFNALNMKTIVLEEKKESTEELVQKGISKGVSYQEYRALVDALALEGKSTDLEQTDTLMHYTILNDKRMKRLDKTLKINEGAIAKIRGIDKEITWLVLTESWCGDAAQTIPMINKVAELNDRISLKVILRDENIDIMNHFLTNEAMSIPRLVMVESKTGEVIGQWGSRPSIVTQMVIDYNDEHGRLTPEFKQDLQFWYNKDKGQSTLEDLLGLLSLE